MVFFILCLGKVCKKTFFNCKETNEKETQKETKEKSTSLDIERKIHNETNKNSEKDKIYSINDIKDCIKSDESFKPIIDRINPIYLTQKEKEMLVKFSVEKENKSKSEEEKSNSNQKVKIARKNFPDNIIQKAKNKTIKYLFIYSQIYFNRYKLNIKKDIKLQKIEYKGFNDDLNKDINLQMLNTPLSTILSYTNRSKCKTNINIFKPFLFV